MTFSARRIDSKLARGLTMAEVRPILRAPPGSASGSLRDPNHPIRQAFKALGWRYQTSRLPDAPYVAGLAKTADELFARDPGTLAVKAESLPGEPDLPWFSRAYLTMAPTAPEAECRSLVATVTSILLDDGQLSLGQARIMEVDLHVVERFHQRTRSGLLRDALCGIGRAVISDIGLLQCMLEADGRRRGATLVMPFADGLILGEAKPTPARDCAPISMVSYIGQAPILDKGRPIVRAVPKSQAHWPGAGTVADMGLAYRAATFVGPAEMHPRQTRLREAIQAIAQRHAPALSFYRQAILWPGRALAFKSQDDRLALARKASAARDDLLKLLEDPEHRGALSRTRDDAARDEEAPPQGPRF